MTSHDEFFTEQQPLAVFKHTLLRQYLTVWASKLGSLSPDLVFIDGYAGTGSYEDGTPGSPLLALDIAREVAEQSNPKNLQCHFVEQRPDHARKLRENVAQHSESNRARVHEGSIEDHLDGILATVGQRPTLVFLDPFGASFDADLLRESLLAERRQKVEVLLNVSLTTVWRIGGLLAANKLESRALNRLDSALGGQWWRQEFIDAYAELTNKKSGLAASKASAKVANKFAERLSSSREGLHVLSVPLRKSLTAGPIFSLLLFYDHPDARMVFIDAAANAHKNWRERYWNDEAIRFSTQPPGLFDLEDINGFDNEMANLQSSNVDAIKENIRGLLACRKEGLVADLAESAFGRTIGTAGDKTMRQALRELHDAGEIADSPSGVRPRDWRIRLP